MVTKAAVITSQHMRYLMNRKPQYATVINSLQDIRRSKYNSRSIINNMLIHGKQ